MTERLVITVLLLALIAGSGVAVRAFLRYRERLRRGIQIDLPQPVDRPAILYFSAPHCSTCRTLQEPALQRLAEHHHKPYTLVRMDATRERELAERCGVLTVPTTVVLEADGVIKAINNGYASEHQLMAQLDN